MASYSPSMPAVTCHDLKFCPKCGHALTGNSRDGFYGANSALDLPFAAGVICCLDCKLLFSLQIQTSAPHLKMPEGWTQGDLEGPMIPPVRGWEDE